MPTVFAKSTVFQGLSTAESRGFRSLTPATRGSKLNIRRAPRRIAAQQEDKQVR